MATFKARGKVSTDRIDMSRLRPTIRSNRVQASIFFRKNVFSVGHARGILSSISSIYMYIYIYTKQTGFFFLSRGTRPTIGIYRLLFMVVLRRSTGSPFETIDILLLYNDATILANFEPE